MLDWQSSLSSRRASPRVFGTTCPATTCILQVLIISSVSRKARLTSGPLGGADPDR